MLNGVHGNADDDQERCATEIKVHAKALQKPRREMTVKPAADAPADVVEVNTGEHPLREQTDDGEIDRADKGEALQNLTDVLAGVTAGTNAGNKTAVLAHVVREFGRIKHDTDIEKRERHNHDDVE